MLPASENWHIGFPYLVGKFIFSIKLKHDSLDELQYSNNVLVTLDGFIFAIPYQIGENNLSALSVKDCERSFKFLFQNLLSINNFIYFSVHD